MSFPHSPMRSLTITPALLAIAILPLSCFGWGCSRKAPKPDARQGGSPQAADSSTPKARGKGLRPRSVGIRAPLKKIPLPDAASKLAVCNDGSPAVFYARPGTQQDSDKWIVHLQGGGSCSEKEECSARPKHQKSSKGARKARKLGGIMDPDPKKNPDALHIPRISASELIERDLDDVVVERVVIEYLRRARSCTELQIINGLVPGNLRRALDGEDVGSIIYKG